MDTTQTAQPIYDTLAATRRLTTAGMPETQAEAVVCEQVHLLNQNLATKADVEVLDRKVETLDKKVDDVKDDVSKTRHSIITWMVGLLMAAAGLVIAALKLP